MPYATNLPLRNRPRGLGDVAERAGGLGSWVVDQHWGLSPEVIQGQNRPYGQAIVQTYLPRTQHPRLLQVQDRPVVAAGTWPTLKSTATIPVFRTPVDLPGIDPTSVPPGLSGGGAFGNGIFGWVPQGVAKPPYNLLERKYGGQGKRGIVGDPPLQRLKAEAGFDGQVHATYHENGRGRRIPYGDYLTQAVPGSTPITSYQGYGDYLTQAVPGSTPVTTLQGYGQAPTTTMLAVGAAALGALFFLGRKR